MTLSSVGGLLGVGLGFLLSLVVTYSFNFPMIFRLWSNRAVLRRVPGGRADLRHLPRPSRRPPRPHRGDPTRVAKRLHADTSPTRDGFLHRQPKPRAGAAL